MVDLETDTPFTSVRLRQRSGFLIELGAHWQCPVTVRSIFPVLTVTVMSRTPAPGNNTHIIEEKEQRVCTLLVSV
jgi:hypothetical protein